MSAVSTIALLKETKAVQVIVSGGLAAGILDLSAACFTWSLRGVKPIRLLQTIASGVLGMSAFKRGLESASLGIGLHFLIAFTATAVYYVASRTLDFMTQQAVVSGLLYGIAVYAFMNLVVIPLSAVPRSPFSSTALIVGLIVHMLCVGLPISIIVRQYSR
jgi:hypothetical protein